MLSTRALAIQTIESVQDGKSLTQILHSNLQDLPQSEKAFFHELVLGTLRHWFAMLRITESFSHKEITDASALAAIHLGMYQLFYLRTPDHAAISETVSAIKEVGKEELSGLVNAMLRRCQKDANKVEKKIHKNHSLPNWLAKQLKQDWKEVYSQLTMNLRQSAPIFLRVNAQKITVADYCLQLDAEELEYSVINDTICLHSRVMVENLPNFEAGFVSVQDIHAQKTINFLPELTDKSVLDACAAPGGKTAQILESYDVSTLLAVDIDEHRVLKIADNLSRLGLLSDKVELLTADVCHLSQHSQTQFDAILLDAPCTATGVIRRHPDISLLRQEDDVQKTVCLQKEILEASWQCLKPKGELLYVTCSLLKQENTEQIASFLKNHEDATEVKINTEFGLQQPHGVQFLPMAMDDVTDDKVGDGFYFCKLQKR